MTDELSALIARLEGDTRAHAAICAAVEVDPAGVAGQAVLAALEELEYYHFAVVAEPPKSQG